MRLDEARAIVTGAAGGLGREICAGLCRAGAMVAALDSDARGLDRLAADVAGYEGKLLAYPVDVTREQQVRGAVEQAFGACGPVNVLVNSAGIYRDGLLVKPVDGGLVAMPTAQWRTVMETDLTGTFLVCREVALRMVAAGVRPAVLVSFSSISRSGNAGQSNYAAAKAGVVAFSRTLALELAPHGIRAAAIAPGFIDTPILGAMDPGRLSDQIGQIPMRRLGTPGEIFAGVRFVIECDYFTGRCLEIDGGLAI